MRVFTYRTVDELGGVVAGHWREAKIEATNAGEVVAGLGLDPASVEVIATPYFFDGYREWDVKRGAVTLAFFTYEQKEG